MPRTSDEKGILLTFIDEFGMERGRVMHQGNKFLSVCKSCCKKEEVLFHPSYVGDSKKKSTCNICGKKKTVTKLTYDEVVLIRRITNNWEFFSTLIKIKKNDPNQYDMIFHRLKYLNELKHKDHSAFEYEKKSLGIPNKNSNEPKSGKRYISSNINYNLKYNNYQYEKWGYIQTDNGKWVFLDDFGPVLCDFGKKEFLCYSKNADHEQLTFVFKENGIEVLFEKTPIKLEYIDRVIDKFIFPEHFDEFQKWQERKREYMILKANQLPDHVVDKKIYQCLYCGKRTSISQVCPECLRKYHRQRRSFHS